MLVRKIDLSLQLLIATTALVFVFQYGLMAVLLCQMAMGIVQLLSALINTFMAKVNSAFRKRMQRYWLGVAVSFLLLFMTSVYHNNIFFLVFCCILPWACSIYYMFTYTQLIKDRRFEDDFQHIVRKQYI
jgi:hypothetical protein